jgi:deoxyribodipyrimidine photo-lyase
MERDTKGDAPQRQDSRLLPHAADFMIDMHGRYALDGRDPNTYTNILWCFGLHDRPWPERQIFGKMRYMSLDGIRKIERARLE